VQRCWSRMDFEMSRGFSLIEVLIATTITVGMGAAVFQLFHQNERIFRDENLVMEMHQAGRMAASQIADDIRIAGQATPSNIGDVILPGSNDHRVNLRGGISATESPILTALPFSAALASSITLKVESTTGFSTGRQVFVWTPDDWVRGTIDSVSGAAKTVRITPTGGSATGVAFTTPPAIALDEAVTLYRDSATSTIRRSTSSNTTNPVSPSWAPANEVAANVIGLSFLYFDEAGTPLNPSVTEERSRISSVEARIVLRTSSRLSNGQRPTYALSVRTRPRALQFR